MLNRTKKSGFVCGAGSGDVSTESSLAGLATARKARFYFRETQTNSFLKCLLLSSYDI
jgi:hypothetical protein